ncbi:MAG: hypothetical protein H7Y12_13455 [Sphingobacteriaceae bacterium]|nr:hypothetical protein [Cytophagaceae bacterium]
MIRSIAFLFLIVSPMYALRAQALAWSGRVLDAATRQPLAGALVGMPSRSLATLTNAEGVFSYKFAPVNRAEPPVVSAIGYRDWSKKAEDLANDTLILLERVAPQLLDSLTQAAHPARRLVDEALNKVRENYPTTPFAMTGFYREILTRDNAPVRLAEAVLKVEHDPAHLPDDPLPEKAKLLRARQYRNAEGMVGLDQFSFGNGTAYVTHSMETGVPEYLEGKARNGYRFVLDSLLDFWHERALWRIRFAPVSNRVKAAREGTLWLDTLTQAIVRIDYEFTSEGRADVLKSTMKSVVGRVFGGARNTVHRVHGFYAYRPFNGKWYLQESGLELAATFQKREEKSAADIRLHFVSSEFFPKINVPLRESEAIQSTENFPLAKGGRYDEGFWGNFNVVRAGTGEVLK